MGAGGSCVDWGGGTRDQGGADAPAEAGGPLSFFFSKKQNSPELDRLKLDRLKVLNA